jgi:hypothetical protein
MMTIEELKRMAAEVASELQAATGGEPAATGGGSRQRGLPEPLRQRFVSVRTALFQRGIFDPVLVRFDTASAPQASTEEIAQQLLLVVSSCA